jgi:hypothetical protein
MRTDISNETITALMSSNPAMAQLIEMDLQSLYWRLNTSAWDIPYGGHTYSGVQAAMGRLAMIEDAPGEVKGLTFELPAVSATARAIALAEPVQGKRIIIKTAVFSQSPTTGIVVLDAPVEWEGRLDTMSISQRDMGDGTTIAVVQVTAEHIGIDLLRPSGYQYTKQDQLRRYAGDMSFEFVTDQADQQIVFPAASYYRK